MKAATEAYKKKVWQFLEKMETGERHTITEICENENTDRFIACIKEYMEVMPWSGHITFNHDYSEFYKMTILNFVTN